MISNYYEIYRNSALELAETIVVKSEYSAKAINRALAASRDTGFDPMDEYTWKYYRNLAGEYYHSDKRMFVTSLDNLETIEFNRQNLQIHRATSRAYQYGSRYFQELVTAYPDQRSLILGILYPVDIDEAIAAPNHTVLGYPEHLIEPHEYDLPAKIQNWVYNFKITLNNEAYQFTDDLFEPAHLGIMFMHLPGAILAFREQACFTNQAHTYHIRMFLASHGMLDKYFDTLTLEQALFFYRNIRYFMRNPGKIDTFEWATEWIMTKRRLPIVGYDMRHETTDLISDLTPLPLFSRVPLNPIRMADMSEVLTTEELLLKEDKIAPGNPRERQDQQTVIYNKLTDSKHDRITTKVLESAMFDDTDSSPYSLTNILFNHWAYLSSKNIYKAYISITNPRTGDAIPMSVREAFIFAMYISAKTYGVTLAKIPKVLAERVQRMPTVMPSELMKVADTRFFDEAFAADLLKFQPVLDPVVSIDAFYEKCVEIFKAANYQLNMAAYQEHFERRGNVHLMYSRIYADHVCLMDPDPEILYADWFRERGITIDDFPEVDFPLLYKEVVSKATGANLTTTTSVRNLQRQMVNMLKGLSSYTVQFITQINADAIRTMHWPVVRPGDIVSTTKSEWGLLFVLPDILSVEHRQGSDWFFDIGKKSMNVFDYMTIIRENLRLCIPDMFYNGASISTISNALLDVCNTTVSYETAIDKLDNGLHPVLGYENYLGMTEDEREQMYRDNYGI